MDLISSLAYVTLLITSVVTLSLCPSMSDTDDTAGVIMILGLRTLTTLGILLSTLCIHAELFHYLSW